MLPTVSDNVKLPPPRREPVQLEAWEELAVEKHWFHVMRSDVMRGRIGDIGVAAWAVYCVLKAHTALDTGRTWPSQQRIAELLKCSVDTVARATDVLIEKGMVTKERAGRRNEYRLTEQVPLTRPASGELVAQADTRYIPLQFQKHLEEIERYAKEGRLPANSKIHITFNVNLIQQGDNSTVNISQVTVADTTGRIGAEHVEAARRLERLRTIDG